jgi:hypothetical protein
VLAHLRRGVSIQEVKSMGTMTQPTIAHGIARLHPEVALPYTYWKWGPEWTLPIDRTGRWAIDTNRNIAVRVEFEEAAPGGLVDHPLLEFGRTLRVRDELERAREALSDEEETRLTEWLGWADKRAALEFTRRWTSRIRRERGQIPEYPRGAMIRGSRSGVWHLATGRTTEAYGDRDTVYLSVECGAGAGMTVDLGEPDNRVERTDDPSAVVCRRCRSHVAVQESGLAEAVAT